jgi:SAM-dependent methyltransferase
MNLKDNYNDLIKMISLSLEDTNLELEVLIKSQITHTLFLDCLKKIKGVNNITYDNTIESLDVLFDDYRMEIYNLDNIRKYCKSESIKGIDMKNIKFVSKKLVRNRDISNYNIKFNLKNERYIPKGNKSIMKNLDNWIELKKRYRYKKRYVFITDDNLFRFDFTIIKSSEKEEVRSKSSFKKKRDVKDYMKKYVNQPEYVIDFNSWFNKLKPDEEVELMGKKNKIMVPHKTIKKAKVFTNPEDYEIEIEFIGNKMRTKETSENILSKMVVNIGHLLQTIQNNYFIISEKEKSLVREHYKKMTGEYIFKAPQSITLNMSNVLERDYNEYSNIVSIRRGYSVTDKADGERNLLIVNSEGECYLWNRKNEIKTLACKIIAWANSILDGEYILKDKDGNNICLFMVFDIYIHNNENVKNRILMRSEEDKEKGLNPSRLEILNSVFENMNINLDNPDSKLKILKKKFFFGDIHNYDINNSKQIDSLETKLDLKEGSDMELEDIKNTIKSLKYDRKIFAECKKVYNKDYIYHIDGLIFTPIELELGQSFSKESDYKYGGRWNELFKWKPLEENSIDFMIKIKKNSKNEAELGYKSINGKTIMYKTLVLMVGYDPKIHTKYNSFIVMNENVIYDDKYSMVPFQPTNPHILNIHLAYIPVENGLMKCSDGSIITDEAIVEFSYDYNKVGFSQWIPMRVRHINKPNDFITALNVWKTINNPITKEMILSGNINGEDDIYYQKRENRKTSITKPMADYHSYIKKKIIKDNSIKGGALLDLACGKGGDLNHLLETELKYVVGIDYSLDNLDSYNGFCNRVLNAYKTSNNELLDNILALAGDSSKNILDGSAANNNLSKYYLDIVYGNLKLSDINNTKLKKFYNIGENGFDVVSMQFALHYMFKDHNMLQQFMNNVSKSLKNGGKFIGTCLDGNRVFKLLENNNSISKYKDDVLLWKITKKYDTTMFSNDVNSLGNKIDVYFNSIGQTISEYLVNFDYFTQLCREYGLEIVNIMSFEKLYNKDINYGSANKMSGDLMTYSFLNNVFIFEKKPI